jgi:hypothetical protein
MKQFYLLWVGVTIGLSQLEETMFENSLLRRIFGPTREDIIGGWRKLHEKLHNLYPTNIIKKIN